MSLIDQVISTSSTTTAPVLGSRLTGSGLHIANPAQIASAACIQAVRVATSGNYEVRLEGGIQPNDGSAIAWSTIATLTQDENENLVTLTIAPGAQYRFRHVSGVNCQVLLN